MSTRQDDGPGSGVAAALATATTTLVPDRARGVALTAAALAGHPVPRSAR